MFRVSVSAMSIGRRALLVGGALLALTSCGQRVEPTSEESLGDLRVGYQRSPAMALVIIASERDMFADHRVDVQLQDFTAGKFALQAFLGGSLDVAIAGDMPTGLALLQGQRLVAFAETIRGSVDEMRMIVRSPGGCSTQTPHDYFMAARRSIATSFGGGPQYFTVKFLEANNVPLSQVRLVSQAPNEMVGALQAGRVDSIAIFDPAAATAERTMPSTTCTFPDPRNYRQHYVAVTRPELMGVRPDPRLSAFIAALRAAETFIHNNPEEASAIVARATGMEAAIVTKLWPNMQFGVTLDPSLTDLWRAQGDFHRSQPDATFPDITPNYAEAIDMRVVNGE